MKNLIFSILGITKKNDEVHEIKAELDKEVNKTLRRYKKINRVILEEGVTLDIARAIGAVKAKQKYVSR